MKYVVLGANGFVGKHLVSHLSKKKDSWDNYNQVIPVTRESFDLLDPLQCKKFIVEESRRGNIDVVIDCAVSFTDKNNFADTLNTLGIFMNFYQLSYHYNMFINLGSGAELDRSTNIEPSLKKEVVDVLPHDSYGFASNIKTRLCLEKNNFKTVRIFNCFGEGEKPTRLFPQLMKAGDEFVVYDNRYFDYICIQDLCTVVEYTARFDWDVTLFDAVYTRKYTIADVAAMFCKIHKPDTKVVVSSIGQNNYIGDGYWVNKHFQVPLKGLEWGLKNYFQA
jgi:GDP-L-fucose synthase